jgi:ABC-type transporter MlaC component
MKKLLTLLFTAMIAFSLAMPVFAQDTGTQEAPKKAEKAKKAKKAKKEKKAKDEKPAAQ